MVILRVGLPHHDERDVEQPVDDEVEDASGLGEYLHVADDDEQEDETARDADGAVRGAEPVVDVVEPVAHYLVPAHGEVDARGRENRGVRAGSRREQAAERERHRSGGPHQHARHFDHRGVVVRHDVEFDHGEEYQQDQRVDNRHDDDAPDDGAREVLAGVLNLLADGRDLDEAEVRDEDESRRRQQRRDAVGCERPKRREVGVERAHDGEHRQNPDERHDDDVLQPPRLLRADVVDEDEQRAGH